MTPEISAIIVEDVLAFHSVIESLLKEVTPNVKVIGNATSLTDAELLIEKLQPNLVFLDIQFETEGKTSFDLLNKLSKQGKLNFQVIIVTAFNQEEYYAEAFNYGALHFLTKPIDKHKLKEAIDRVKSNFDNPGFESLLSQLSKFHVQLHSEETSKLAIESYQYTELIEISNITYLEGSGHYTFFHLRSNPAKPVCSSTNIGEYERKLASYPIFFRIHRNLIINVDHVERYSKKDYSIMMMEPFRRLQASKDRFKEFVRLMEEQNGTI
jgi:two-component system LytT family response regulator